MSDNSENNPFYGLFGSVNDAQSFTHQNDQESAAPSTGEVRSESPKTDVQVTTTTNLSEEDPLADKINSIIEDVFCITISRKVGSKPLVFIEETSSLLAPVEKLDVNTLEQALFDRLLLDEPGANVVTPSSSNIVVNHHVIEKECLTYLFECHKQLMELKNFKPGLEKAISDMDALVIRNVSTALTQPDLYHSQQLHNQFIDMFNDYDNSQDHLSSMVNSLVDITLKDEGDMGASAVLSKAFFPILDELRERVLNSTLLTLNRYHIHLIQLFSKIPSLGDILLQHSTPRHGEGSLYGDTLLGAILSTSCLPRSGGRYKPNEQFQFDRNLEDSFWTGLKFVCDSMHTIFFNIFRNSVESRHALLAWIGNCLHANVSRGKLQNTHDPHMSVLASLSTVSDGFMMNLGGVLLRLCKPFTDRKAMPKLLKIDPTYCAVEINDEEEADRRCVHLKGMASETCLNSMSTDNDNSESAQRPTAPSYNFVSEIFFMTHRALDLGVRVVFDKWMQINTSLARAQRHLESASSRLPETAQSFRQFLETEMTRSLAMRATLLEPLTLVLLGDLYVATAEWLIQVAIQPPFSEQPESYAPIELRSLSFPLPDYIPPTLSCVPEFLMENVACYQSMVRRFAPHTLEERGTQLLAPLLSQVLVFMGCKQRMRNPHLRARLAECLESLLPQREQDDVSSVLPPPPSINREKLFKSHPHRSQIVPCLLNVFVGIEMTGESVEFEQKFNYRRPMYVAMDYLWTLQEQREVFKTLAMEAEANMEAVNPPLFLRFINLLMNDAVYLLDEALSNMAQLRNFQTARDNGEWDNLPARDRQQNEGYLQHVGMIARFDNILGKETIHTLKYITTEVTSIFSHPTMVNRIAAMLNHFLIHLVGPKKKNFKVKDKQEYDFKPEGLVMDICRIYINLGKSDSFCLAVSQDGRSYNSDLFRQAEQVLVRIGGGMLITDLMQVASRVAELATQQNAEDEVLAEAPEEFYDPILSTLMSDPVILPSSKTTCDRSTIARHLLSDQTDPFNRSPLTMDQVIPNVELKKRIEAWIIDRKSQRSSRSTSQQDARMETD